MKLLTKQKKTPRFRERIYGCWVIREFGINMYTPLYLNWITNKDLLYSTGNSAQSYMAAWMGREFRGK